jgi:hypothetical protein
MISFKTIFLILLAIALLAETAYSTEVHQNYDWWEPSFQLEPPPPEFASCAACHESLGVSGDVHPRSRKYCEDCHLLGRSGPFVYYRAADLYRNFNYSAPMIYNHIINASNAEVYYKYPTETVEVEDQSNKFNGAAGASCFGWNPDTGQGTCHGISSESPVDGFFAFNLSNQPSRESPYRYTVETTHLPDSTDCLYCHRQENQEIVLGWGDPGQVDPTHFNSLENEECYECHVQGGITLTSFHIMGPEPEVIFLQPQEPTPPPPTTPPPTTTTTSTTTTTTSTSTTTSPSTTLPPQTIPPTTMPPTSPPPSKTQPPTESPKPTKTPFYTGNNSLYLGAGLAVLLLLAAIIYFNKKTDKQDEEKENSK